jgi:predicted RNase H-like HicB family nuclease
MDTIAIIHKEAASDFGVSFPDFPGCITAGRTLEEAKAMAAEALNAHVEILREDKAAIPAPSTLDAVMRSKDFRNGVAFLVSLDQPDRTVRINITLTQSELTAIDRVARERGMSRSALLVKSSLHTR